MKEMREVYGEKLRNESEKKNPQKHSTVGRVSGQSSKICPSHHTREGRNYIWM
jgi:hypothetical protein